MIYCDIPEEVHVLIELLYKDIDIIEILLNDIYPTSINLICQLLSLSKTFVNRNVALSKFMATTNYSLRHIEAKTSLKRFS